MNKKQTSHSTNRHVYSITLYDCMLVGSKTLKSLCCIVYMSCLLRAYVVLFICLVY
jgi:hypothetical protein